MSAKVNEQNERIKRRFAIWKREARRAQMITVDKTLEALKAFKTFTGNKDFKLFKLDQAVEFKRHLESRKSRASGKPLAKATIDGTLRAVKDFFDWLADQPGIDRVSNALISNTLISMPRMLGSHILSARSMLLPLNNAVMRF